MIKREKKAQAEVIVTVLIILLVLAIVGIVGVMVNKTVKRGSAEAETRAKCINVKATIETIDLTAKTVTVTRGPGGSEEATITFKVLVGGINDAGVTINPIAGIGEMETATITVPSLGVGKEVSIAPLLGGGTIVCEIADKQTAPAA